MRRMVLAALLVTFGAGVALAAEQAPAQAAPAAAPAKPAACPHAKKAPAVSKCEGTVEAVDAATGSLSVKDAAGAVKSFTVGEKVKIRKGGKKAALKDVAVGDPVIVKFGGPADKPEVKSVTVKVPKAAKK